MRLAIFLAIVFAVMPVDLTVSGLALAAMVLVMPRANADPDAELMRALRELARLHGVKISATR